MKTLFSLPIIAIGCALLAGCGEYMPDRATKSSSGSKSSTRPATPDVTAPAGAALKTQEMSEEEMASRGWPVFRGDAMGSGRTDQTLPDSLDVLWQYKVDGGAFESTAAIVDGVVYIGDLDDTVFALDLETGEVKWEFKVEIGFYAAPAVQDGLYLVPKVLD